MFQPNPAPNKEIGEENENKTWGSARHIFVTIVGYSGERAGIGRKMYNHKNTSLLSANTNDVLDPVAPEQVQMHQ